MLPLSGLNIQGGKVAKTILITGGTRGIGRALAEQYLARGFAVIATGSTPRSVDQARTALPQIDWQVCDLREQADLAALCQHIGRRALDRVVHNAGVQQARNWFSPGGEAISIEDETRINFTAPVLLTRALFDNVHSAHGRWIFITSGLAIAPKQSAAVYCANKAALRVFCKSLNGQIAVTGSPIKVCEAILPLVDTAMTQGRGRGKISPEQAAAEIIRGAERGLAEIYVGKVRWLMRLRAFWPNGAENLMIRH